MDHFEARLISTHRGYLMAARGELILRTSWNVIEGPVSLLKAMEVKQ